MPKTSVSKSNSKPANKISKSKSVKTSTKSTTKTVNTTKTWHNQYGHGTVKTTTIVKSSNTWVRKH